MDSLFSPDWQVPGNVIAYCTTRHGGFSNLHYAGLNIGNHVGDDPLVVSKNRALLPFHERIHWLNQVHGIHVLSLPSEEVNADAAISRSSSAFCAVMTADCVPVLLCDTEGKEVAAIHAGWKGLAGNIIFETVSKMHSNPDSISAWIGPAICGEHYEVPKELARMFDAFSEVVKPSSTPEKFLLNLPAIARQQLEHAGVHHVSMSDACTYGEPSTFYSHRVATHQGLPATGRFVSVIGLR